MRNIANGGCGRAPRRARISLVAIWILSASGSIRAQHQHPPEPQPTQTTSETEHHEMPAMVGPLGIPLARDGSGTSWLPDETPVHATHHQVGAWVAMLHANAFAQYVDEPAPRGDEDFGSVNWVMGMAHRQAGGGQLMLRAMLSLEPATLGDCGYPLLLQSGETCDGAPLHDRQHPHDLFMELAARFQREATASLAYELYAGLSGEPALGPVAFPHRNSALPNPLAPIAHHWLDSSHISFGVLSAGLYGRKWKAEGSWFNGREPDEERWDLDLARLDSYAGRAWFLPTDRWALQLSAGHLEEAEPSDPGAPRIDVDRFTASANYHRRFQDGGSWTSTLAWGRNRESGTDTDAALAESAWQLDPRNSVFGRAEVVEKTAEDLVLSGFDPERTFTLGRLQLGYSRRLAIFAGWALSAGGSVSLSVVPAELEPVYDGRTSSGFAAFLNLRPEELQSAHATHSAGHAGH